MRIELMIAAAVLAAAGVAQAAPHGREAFVADYDTDRDGKVSKAEFHAVRAERLRAMDKSADGKVDEAEYVGEYEARLEAQLAASKDSEEDKTSQRQRQMRQAHVRFGVLDKDKDGALSEAEFAASGERAFAEQDGDHDGFVTASEPKPEERAEAK
jgi:hypothetical protein